MTVKSRICSDTNSNSQGSGLVAKSSAFKTKQFRRLVFTFKILGVFQYSVFTKANLHTSQKPGNPPYRLRTCDYNWGYVIILND